MSQLYLTHSGVPGGSGLDVSADVAEKLNIFLSQNDSFDKNLSDLLLSKNNTWLRLLCSA